MTVMTENIDIVENKIGYIFKNKDLLISALTHRSYANEHKEFTGVNYERLEFVGDALLGLVTSKFLYNVEPRLSDGEMSKYRAKIVCEENLYKVAKTLEIGEHILMSKGARMNGGADKSSILSDVIEAVTAAIYLDSDIESAADFLNRNVLNVCELDEIVKDDSKSRLQELLAAQDLMPRYELLSDLGPDHRKTFETAVYINDVEYGRGVGNSKKQSQMRAAERALKKIKQETENLDVSKSN